MAKPTLFFTPTTVTLPYPNDATEDPGLTRIMNVTLGGQTRVQRIYRKRVWSLSYTRCPRTTFDALSTLLNNAAVANTFPTFSFTEVFALANAVPVYVEATEFHAFGPRPDLGDFELTLTMAGTY
jgi:hypothetical protein